MTRVGDIATVKVDGRLITGTVYHVRENGWPCVESPGHVASGPEVELFASGDPIDGLDTWETDGGFIPVEAPCATS